MYNELYEAWKREYENRKLGKLPSNFYSRAAEYLGKLKEEGRMLDKRSVKAQLLKGETRNVKRMVYELIRIRYRKIFNKAARDEKIASDFLATEEKKMYMGVLPLAEAFRSFTEKILRGHASEVSVEQQRKKTVVRFLEKTPSIIGLDMETYGPFELEDVASLPVQNCKILVKKGLAERIEA
jgi:DNA replication factor GINS